jgi:SOS-response transcriptional repressor LexA
MEQKVSKTRQKINALCEENEYASMKQNQTRARSLSVGTAGGGIIELNMRGDYGNLWYQMQPTEAIEIIGQIAAASGIEIAMRPRQDFSSWRSWDTSLPSSVAWMGAAPWQLTEEARMELEAAKAKNIKAIRGSDGPE